MEGNVLHMVGPYYERSPAGAPSKKIVTSQQRQIPKSREREIGNSPCVLDYEA